MQDKQPYVNCSLINFKVPLDPKLQIMIYSVPTTLLMLYKRCLHKVFSIKGFVKVKTFHLDKSKWHLPSSYYY